MEGGKKREKKGFAKRAAMVKTMVSVFKPKETEMVAPAGKHFGVMDMVPPENVSEEATMSAVETPFVDPEQTKRLLRGQLTDLTKKLSKALTNIDDIYEGEKTGASNILVMDVSMKINQMKSGDLKDQLKDFLVHFNEVTEENKEASKEREEIFTTLSEWFTMETEMKGSFEDFEDTDLKQNYADTLAEFEKLKKVLAEISRLAALGEDTTLLELEKRALEKRVIELMKTTQECMPAHKGEPKQEVGVWKTAATEIIELLKTVKTDHPDILIGINKRLDYMAELLEKQDEQILSLLNEMSEKKRVIANFVDENNTLNTSFQTAKKKIDKYHTELDLAQKILQQCFATKEDEEDGRFKVTVSSMIDQLGGDPDAYDDDPASSSDPFLLRGVIEDHEETIDILENKVANLLENVEMLEKVTDKQKDKIETFKEEKASLEVSLESKTNEADGFLRQLEEISLRYEQQRDCIASMEEELQDAKGARERASKSTMILPGDFSNDAVTMETVATEISTSFSHVCNRCNCHLTQSQMDIMKNQWSDGDEIEEDLEDDVPTGFALTHTSPNPDNPIMDEEHADIRQRPLQRAGDNKKEVRINVNSKPASKLPPIDHSTINTEEFYPGKTHLLGVAEVQCKLDDLIQDVMSYVSLAGRVLAQGDNGHTCTHAQRVGRMTPYNEKHQVNSRMAKQRSTLEYMKMKKTRRVMLVTAQRTVILLKEIYDSLAKELDLQHNDFEIIYRALKTVQRYKPGHTSEADQGQRVKYHKHASLQRNHHQPPQTAPSSSNLYADDD